MWFSGLVLTGFPIGGFLRIFGSRVSCGWVFDWGLGVLSACWV